jgi:hydroxymethylpyrimidine/phosphomethylpyrimidine kinase
MKPKRILTIAGSDSGGGAGIQADLKTITVLGGFGMSVITALTAQNTLGIKAIHKVPPAFVAKQFDAVAEDIGANAAKTGMLVSAEIIQVVAEKIRQYGIEELVVDPVMVAKGGAQLIRQGAIETLKKALIPLARVVTPNIPEAEVLSGLVIASREDMKRAAHMIHGLGARNVVIKGGHLPGLAIDLLYNGKDFLEFSTERINTEHTHGTGCTYSATIATMLAFRKSLPEAVREAKAYITLAIQHSLHIGSGQGPIDHFAAIREEVKRLRNLVKCDVCK